MRRVLAALALPLVAALVISACGATTTSDTTPGISDKERKVDRSKFEMAQPDATTASTTIPGAGPTLVVPTSINPTTGEAAVLGQKPPSQGGPDPFTAEPQGGPNTPFTIPKSTTTVPRTTTTPPPPTTVPVPPAAPLSPPNPAAPSLCGFAEYFRSLIAIIFNPVDNLPTVLAGVRGALAVYRSAVPAQVADDFAVFSAGINDLIAELEQVGFDSTNPTFQATMAELVQKSPSHATFTDAFSRIAFVEAAQCGSS